MLVADGNVGVGVEATSGGGAGSGGVPDEGAAATTTFPPFAITDPASPFPTTMILSSISSSVPTLLIDDSNFDSRPDSDASSLLRMAMVEGDGSSSVSGSGHSRSSGGSLGFHRIADCSPSPPAVAGSRAARRSDDRPTVCAMILMAAAPPRPGPASLLSSSERPQPGRVTLLGGRAGSARRTTETGNSELATCGAGRINGPASTLRLAKQVPHAFACANAHVMHCVVSDVPREGAAAGIRTVPIPCLRSDGVQDNGK